MAEAIAPGVEWRLVGDEIGTCNCDWACPCQFGDVRPTREFCEAISTFVIREGHYGDTDLGGVRFAWAFHWPGAVHEGNGHRMLVMDASTTQPQRDALVALTNGTEGHPFFEIFTSVAPNVEEPVIAPINVAFDSEARTAKVSIDGLAENTVEPIIGAGSGQEVRVRLDLPNGFEFKRAEIANSVGWHVDGPGPLAMRNERTYTHICPIDWTSDGTTR
jgi:hypothetical protein